MRTLSEGKPVACCWSRLADASFTSASGKLVTAATWREQPVRNILSLYMLLSSFFTQTPQLFLSPVCQLTLTHPNSRTLSLAHPDLFLTKSYNALSILNELVRQGRPLHDVLGFMRLPGHGEFDVTLQFSSRETQLTLDCAMPTACGTPAGGGA